MKVGVNGVYKEHDKSWVGINGVWKEIEKMWSGVGGVWREVDGLKKSMFLACGGGNTLYSYDGINWGSVPVYNESIAGNSNMLIGMSPNSTKISADGINWATATHPFYNNWAYGIAYGNGRFVSIGMDIQGYAISAITTDGVNWTYSSRISIPEILYTRRIAFGNGVFIAYGQNGFLATSTDGLNWTKRNTGITGEIHNVLYSSNLWVAVGDNGRIARSTDGYSWVGGRPSGIGDDNTVYYGLASDNNGNWIACGYFTTTYRIIYSSSMPAWSFVTFNHFNPTYAIYGNGIWVVTNSGYGIATSVDGKTWVKRADMPSAITRNSMYFWEG